MFGVSMELNGRRTRSYSKVPPLLMMLDIGSERTYYDHEVNDRYVRSSEGERIDYTEEVCPECGMLAPEFEYGHTVEHECDGRPESRLKRFTRSIFLQRARKLHEINSYPEGME